MSGYKTFAVAGAGNLGKIIVEELAKLKKEGAVSAIKVLTRSADTHADLVALGVEPLTVDYTSASSLSAALKGLDVLISTLGGAALGLQVPLATAAKEAGVKLFVPSEFGNVSLGASGGIFAGKENVRLKLLDLGLPYAVFYTGPFPDMVFTPALGFDTANGKATIGPNGDALMSWTARVDVASFLAHVLTSLPPSKLENSIWRVEGERTSFNAIFAGYEARTGTKINATYTPKEVLEANIKANPFDIKSVLLLQWSEGGGVVGTPEEVSNAVWPEWKPTKALDALGA